ncbi:zeta toxin family protein [Croceimicrobium hydrocarbonivorans]|nr:zeta toxin family protein [Croceimicrobium hydrocarbonivorans]QNR23006.1 zeta toxin family protein [Croceimicrobium hydrocarbonivorans]
MSNNNANIKRVEQRIKELEVKSKIAESGKTPEVKFDGGVVVLNALDNRIQIFFDDKPDANTRDELKKSGFKWAPSKKAWQRMVTDNAIFKTAKLSFIKSEGPWEDLFKVNQSKKKTLNPISDPKKKEWKVDLKALAASIRNLLNLGGGNAVKVSTKTSGENRSDHHIFIEMRDGSSFDKRTRNILESWPLDKGQVKGYGLKIYTGQAMQVQEAIKEVSAADDFKEIIGCPPMKDGKRLIDAESIRKLESCIANLPQTKKQHTNEAGEYQADRLKLHAKIIGEFKKDAKCTGGKKPIAILTGGAPGAGKSTFLKNFAPWLLSDSVYHIDADEVRAKLPEYKGWNASATHEETSDITKKLIREIGKPCEYDLIYDGTMNKAKKYGPLVTQLKDLGYQVFVIYLQVPKELSKQRVLDRYKTSGRYVPMSVIDEIYENGLEAYDEVIKSADGFIRVNGETQEIVEKGGMQLPKRRKLANQPSKSEPSKADRDSIGTIRKEINEYLILSENQVRNFAEKINRLRKVNSQKIDGSQINKKVLPLTADGLFRWAKNPGAYDLPGIDAPDETKPTIKPRKIKKLEPANSSSGGFWQQLWNGK